MYDKLKHCEIKFLEDHPEGFASESLKDINRKHNFSKMVTITQENLEKSKFRDVDQVINSLLEIVNKSSLVSRFEKPKFKEFITSISDIEKELLVRGYEMLLYENEKNGFNQILEVYTSYNIAKWPIMSIVQACFKPGENVFIKPTTVKNIIKYFEIDTIKYSSKPTYEFYNSFRDIINDMKVNVDASLYPSNAAFSGFLMMTMDI